MSRLPSVTGIVLAAGEGRRMGRTKQLLPFRGQTILECVVENALVSCLQRVIVVLGHQADILEPLLKGRDVGVVINPDYGSGQSTSLKAGLHAVTDEVDAVLFLLGDQPLITPETINSILTAYQLSTSSPIVLPLFEHRRGNPALFSRETFTGIKGINGDCGARALFEKYADRILEVTVDDPAIHMDVDTEEDFCSLLKRE